MPKISVVMPVYNGERYLREAVDSILAQTYSDFEFIIIDDGSTDASAEIVRSYTDARIRFYQNDRNMGVAATLNRGLDLARGEYIARMDADDISLPKRFAKQVAYLDAHPECAVLGCDMELFGAQIGVFAHAHTAEQLKVDLLFASALGHPTVMMRSAVVGRNGLHYNEAYNGIEDYELWVRVAEKYAIGNLSEDLLRYRMHPAQVTQNHTARYSQLHRDLKARQMRSLDMEADGRGFALFVRYCMDGQVKGTEEKRDLVAYLYQILRSNAEKKEYAPTELKETVMIRTIRMLATLCSKDRRLIMKEHHIRSTEYVLYRLKSAIINRLQKR